MRTISEEIFYRKTQGATCISCHKKHTAPEHSLWTTVEKLLQILGEVKGKWGMYSFIFHYFAGDLLG